MLTFITRVHNNGIYVLKKLYFFQAPFPACASRTNSMWGKATSCLSDSASPTRRLWCLLTAGCLATKNICPRCPKHAVCRCWMPLVSRRQSWWPLLILLIHQSTTAVLTTHVAVVWRLSLLISAKLSVSEK